MSAKKQVEALLSEAGGTTAATVKASLAAASQEIHTMLEATKSSFNKLCINMEKARNKAEVLQAFKEFNAVVRILLEAAPGDQHDHLVRDVLCSFDLSKRLRKSLLSTSPVPVALLQYKEAVATDLAVTMREQTARALLYDEKDEEMLLRLLPVPSPPHEGEPIGSDGAPQGKGLLPKKRTFAEIDELPVTTKVSAVPALASLSRMQELIDQGSVSKKQALLTREKLRAGLHDPRGLLQMVGSSTNALERAKKMEILKCAGFVFDENKKSQGKVPFADKLQMARTRLELGLGGHTLGDTLLFGAKVLSTPGVLTPKNISDVESNVTEAKTTWRHQNAYVKMVIAGCMNQARSIFEKFDEILHGPAPEKLVEETHKNVRRLLKSQECQIFHSQVDKTDKDAVASCDNFIRKLTEAVAPILPITLRNKSLDGGYFRAALQLAAAAEFLFAQYEADVRIKANPAGVVGMCNNMHADIKRSAIYNEELKPLGEFIKDMKTQYQTSMGLGTSFARDPSISKGGRGKKARSHWRSFAHRGQNFSRSRGMQQLSARGRGSGGPHTEAQSSYDEASQWRNAGPGVCYAYQAGNCMRGRSCRFSH